MSTSTSGTAPSGFEDLLPRRNPFALLFSFDPYKAMVFHLLSFTIGMMIFVGMVTLFSVGISFTMSVILAVIGIPILALMPLLSPYLGHVERARVGAFTGMDIDNPYKPLPDGSIMDQLNARFRDGALWRDLIYLALLFPIGIAEFAIAVVAVSVPVSLIFSPVILALGGVVRIGALWYPSTVAETLPLAIIGVILLVLAFYVLTVMMRAHGVFARWLIGPSDRDQLAARVETLAETRSRMVGVSLEDRRHIERDLHDGAQPRLVNLAMNLGLAREKLDSDPQLAKELIERAHQESKDVLAEIRNIVRGLHPSVLTDRGLDAAIASLAGQCAIPVEVVVELEERPPEAVETTAYYVVAEALTNIAKHSNASSANIVVQRDNGNLRIDVVDDGVGGAAPSPGSGLAGLHDRVEALDGTLEINSPEGGPTRISATLPIEQ